MMYGKQTTEFMSLIAGRFGRGIGRFILFVLMVNFLSTAALSTANANSDDNFLPGEQSVVICTPQGLKRITLDKNGNPTKGNEGRLEHCIYCLPFHKVIANTASLVVESPVLNPVSYRLYFPQYISLSPEAPLNTACPPRAPPVA